MLTVGNSEETCGSSEHPQHHHDDPSGVCTNEIVLRSANYLQYYKVYEKIGSGKFGDVKRCVMNDTEDMYAAKVIRTYSKDDVQNVMTEIAVMKKLRHPRLLQLHDAYRHKDQMVLILELITGGELFDRIIDESFELTESKCENFVREICDGVEFIHSHDIIHLDLKPENILCITRTGYRIKIIDFGLARFMKNNLRVTFGTPEFVAPEVVNYDTVGKPTDMWSVGVITYVLLSGLSPFLDDSDPLTFYNVCKAKYVMDYPEFDEISPDAKDFIRSLLLIDKEKRLTARECLSHKWLANVVRLKRKGTVNKRKLKHFVYRRKWQKAINVIIAVIRMKPKLSATSRCNILKT